jgi:hypothetical protein
VTDAFESLARSVAKSFGKPALPLLVLPHPFGGLPEAEIHSLADRVAPEIESFVWDESLTSPAGESDGPDQHPGAESEADGERASFSLSTADETEAGWELYARGLTDGLPVIPPTAERVRAMLDAAGLPPDAAVGPIPPALRSLTAEAVAANAVMAGCEPSAFPIVWAAVEASLDERFNLFALQVTTHPCGVAVLVSGPIAGALSIRADSGCLGPGWRANMTIGRAVRLTLANGGECVAGGLDRATFGQPGKLTMCFAENGGRSPWGPWRPEGIDGPNSVTVIAAEAPHNINDHGSTDAEGVLRTIAGTMATTGNNNLTLLGDTYVLLGPEHAATLAAGGLSREDVARELHRRARVRATNMSTQQLDLTRGWSGLDTYVDEDGCVPVARDAADIHVVVAGGEGKHSMWLPTFGISYSVSRAVTA